MKPNITNGITMLLAVSISTMIVAAVGNAVRRDDVAASAKGGFAEGITAAIVAYLMATFLGIVT